MSRVLKTMVAAGMLALVVMVTTVTLASSYPTMEASSPLQDSGHHANSGPNPLQVPPKPDNRCLVVDDPGPCGVGGGVGGRSSRGRGGQYTVTLPNLYGHYTLDQAQAELQAVMDKLPSASSSAESSVVTRFLCTLYLPPCLSPRERGLQPGGGAGARGVGGGVLPLPCRPLCEVAREEVQRLASASSAWPSSLRCHMFPTERCFALAGPEEVKYVSKALLASGAGARMNDVIPQSVAPLESELGDDDPYDVQVVTMGANQIPPRRYDITDLGDPAFFQGWADVQGSGAANDYCRVIGKGKRRFLSCALAGTRGQDHQYVSKLGFQPGHPATWFMRDVDSDGRDDYCRCIGEEARSRVVCMKAGDKGFYGSTVQGGSDNTFELPRSQGCHHRHLNPHFGL